MGSLAWRDSTLLCFHDPCNKLSHHRPIISCHFCSWRKFRRKIHMKVISIYYIKRKRSRGEPSISINPNETHARRRFFAVQEESSGAFRASFISYDPIYRSPYCSFLLQQLIEELPNDRLCLIYIIRFPPYLTVITARLPWQL